MSEAGGRSIKTVALGHSSGFHVLFTDGAQLWHNLSAVLRSNLRGKGKEIPAPRFVALGPGNRWFAGYEGGRHRWGSGPPTFDKLLLRAFRLIEFVAFGPGNAWFVRFQDGGYAYDGLPPKLTSFLEGKDAKFQRKAVKRMALGPTGEWWVLLEDGTSLFAILDPDLCYILETHKVRDLSLGPNGGYVAIGDFGMAWSNVDPEFEEVKKYIQKGGQKRDDSTQKPDMAYEEEPQYEEESECERAQEQAPSNRAMRKQNPIGKEEQEPGHSDRDEPYLDPSLIRYTKVSIKAMLRNNAGSVYDLVASLESGELIPEEAPRIRVVKQAPNQYWTLDNRWLWAFNKAGLGAIPVRFVDADEEFFRRKAVVGEGWDVAVIDD